ncbi:peroxisomal membrane protein 2, pxmp2, putative [Perkinsus marinus ATCC 50983]|uniref:Peroxisomal membrane protein 2, pxmp2, putative n=1 Tax=Perkinsus marinus (strain ATCC 50983 / TXsc) TaxID=423536 RepID=C5KKJ6_PERM5|nr:peroxisomal membrane protein 2, pxmp2, putative [Perkinsus marinus ATCC 50983]EER15108.1 peroxisomal membrane protein 2, pxmp2, putative [Perkinsus marinus ATCC 50983]|eukprot:XP_002783312.1 peroxisomal membrane protein 2, pxmp2, putative [Perkinsus marinus ATCC 50983]
MTSLSRTTRRTFRSFGRWTMMLRQRLGTAENMDKVKAVGRRTFYSFVIMGGSDVCAQWLTTGKIEEPDWDRAFIFAAAGSVCMLPLNSLWAFVLEPRLPGRKWWLTKLATEMITLTPLYFASLIGFNAWGRYPNADYTLVRIMEDWPLLYRDSLIVIPLCQTFNYLIIAPHMRNFFHGCCSFLWNIYVSWYVSLPHDQREANIIAERKARKRGDDSPYHIYNLPPEPRRLITDGRRTEISHRESLSWNAKW